MPQTEAGLRHYLGTNLRAEYSVIAIKTGLKTSNDLYTCFRRKTKQLCTHGVHYKKAPGLRLPLQAAS